MMTHWNILLLVTLLIFQNINGIPRLDPLVDSNAGLIRGLRASDGDYSMFLGIPYATVDENNPFGPSTPHPRFDTTFEAYDDSAICPQIEEFNNTLVGTLDCLHLNIYVPNVASSRNRLPVLVWIYGGGFSIGFAGRYLYGARYLVRHDIILITLNYRLGPYGFMCLDTPQVPGNQGLKDQLSALRWINDNIEAFGGDINKITIFGESAGSLSVDWHLRSEQEKLFSSVIMESGTSLNPRHMTGPDPNGPLSLAEQLGFQTNDYNEALAFLISVDTNLVIAAASAVNFPFRPCVENNFENVENFITDYPVNQRIPKARGMPILVGFNNNEMLATYVDANPDDFRTLNIFNDLLRDGFDFENSYLMEMEEIVRHFYIGDDEISENVKFEIIDFASDFRFNHPTERSIAEYVYNGANKVFYYVFSYSGERNFVKRRSNITIGGASHADELGYLFDMAFMTEEPTSSDRLTIDRMTTMWANFVKYGDPTPETSDLLPVKWEPITAGSPYNYLDINSELAASTRPFNNRMAFWDLFYKTNWNSQKGYLANSGA